MLGSTLIRVPPSAIPLKSSPRELRCVRAAGSILRRLKEALVANQAGKPLAETGGLSMHPPRESMFRIAA